MGVFRPLPAYDGSIGPLPATDVTNDDLLKRYSITKPTLFKRRDALVENGWVTPQKIGPRVFYSAQDVHLLDCVCFWSSKAYTIAEIVAHLRHTELHFQDGKGGEGAEEETMMDETTIDIPAENSTTDLVVKGLQTSAKDLQMLGDEFVEKFANRVGQEIQKSLPKDLLTAHDFLSKAAARNYLLSGKILAEGMGFKMATIHGWPDVVDKHGFRIRRIGKGQWRVRELTDEEIEAGDHPTENSGWININNQNKAA
jgi:hypothetical protein